MSTQKTEKNASSDFSLYEFAELSDVCKEKIQEWERELNKQGYWNIALVAYQLKG